MNEGVDPEVFKREMDLMVTECNRLMELLEKETEKLEELQKLYDELKEKYDTNVWVLDEIEDRLRKRKG